MKKHVSLLIFILLTSLVALGCSNSNVKNDSSSKDTKKESVKIAGLKGPTSIGMIKLFDDQSFSPDNYTIDISAAASPDIVKSGLLNEEYDIAAVPTNLASIMYNKTKGKYKLAAVNTLGVLYIVSNGVDITSLEQLKGQTLYSSGKGSVPDYALNYLLSKNGIDPEKDIKIDYSLTHNELAQAVIGGDVKIALLPEPFVTMVSLNNKDVKTAINIQDEWKKIEGEDKNLVMGCIVVKTEFADNNPEFVKEFLNAYKKSVEWVNTNHEEASKLVEKHEILPKAKIAELAIPNCNITFLPGEDAKDITNDFLKILMDYNPKSIGGKLPDEGFYYSN